MKLLRKTIRRILSENLSANEEKILNLIESGDPDYIIQAIELADAVGIITVTESRKLFQVQQMQTYKFKCNSNFFKAKLARMQGSLSKGFYRGKSDVLLSVYNTGECSVTVNI